jgi:predicted RNA-binding Zn ribbon-like protein
VEFEFIAGNPALDFVATVSERRTAHRERLAATDDLADWLVKAGVLDTAPEVDAEGLAAARELREALFEMTVCLTKAQVVPPDVRAVVNRYAAAAPPVLSLGPDNRSQTTGNLVAALSALARAGISLASRGAAAEISWCSDATCTRPFVDRSRGKRRKWCGMSGCGDRAKAAAYRRRRAVAGSPPGDR